MKKIPYIFSLKKIRMNFLDHSKSIKDFEGFKITKTSGEELLK